MLLVGASPDAFLVTSLAVSIPWLYYTQRSPVPGTSLRRFLNLFLLIHTLYILHTIIVAPPPNLFTRLGIPINTSTETIRGLLLQYADPDIPLPAPVETLLKRLGSFESRALFVRFGQYVVQTCEYCQTYDEFALYALPRPILAYIRETAVIGIVTIKGTRRERLRTFGIGVLIFAAVVESYWTIKVPIKIPRKEEGAPAATIMWHDTLYILRHILFMLLPIILHIFPPSKDAASASSLASLPATLATLDGSVTRLHLLKYTRGAVLRNPELRERAGDWWEEERKEGEWVRGDEGVQKVAEKLGFGFADPDEEGKEGKLRTSARMAIQVLKSGFAPSEHWRS